MKISFSLVTSGHKEPESSHADLFRNVVTSLAGGCMELLGCFAQQSNPNQETAAQTKPVDANTSAELPSDKS